MKTILLHTKSNNQPAYVNVERALYFQPNPGGGTVFVFGEEFIVVREEITEILMRLDSK